MRFSTGLFPGTFARFAAFLTIAFALLLTGYEHSYATTTLTTSAAEKSSPIDYSTNLKTASNSDGRAFVPGKRSTASPATFTNSIDSKTRASLATPIRSVSDSADRTAYRSTSYESSTISISRSSRITQANRYAGSLSSDISRTVLPFSAANRATSSLPFVTPPARSLRTLPIDRRSPSFSPPFSGSEIGRTSALLPRRNSISPGSWRHWTRGQPSFARSWTENSYALPSPRKRSRDSTSWSRASSHWRCTNRR